MKRIMAVAALTVALGACYQSEPPRDFRERMIAGPLTGAELDMLRKDDPGMTALCLKKVRARGINGMSGVPLDQCYEMTPQRRWTGLWRNDFEGSLFCEVPATECKFGSVPDIWFDYDFRNGPCCDGKLYAVEFIGRRTKFPGIFGHMGGSDYQMTVDRMISVREVGPPAPFPTDEEINAIVERKRRELDLRRRS